MPISALQIDAFERSPTFNEQVNGTVAREALYRSSTWEYLDAGTRSLLAQVARSPESSGFAAVIVADVSWNMTYDQWAADPPGAEGTINSAVQTHWLLLTNIEQPLVYPEPPEGA